MRFCPFREPLVHCFLHSGLPEVAEQKITLLNPGCISSMNFASLSSPRLVRRFSLCFVATRKFCHGSLDGGKGHEGFQCIDEPMNTGLKSSNFDSVMGERSDFYEREEPPRRRFSLKWSFLESTRIDAKRVFKALKRDDYSGFDVNLALDELGIRVSGLLVREVLFGILKNNTDNYAAKMLWADLGYKFFLWSGKQENYKHTVDSYHIMLKIFSECEDIEAMCKLVDEMIEKEMTITARTLNILIWTSVEYGKDRKDLERFIKSKRFNYRPYRNRYNAILHCLLLASRYELIEWVYQQMLLAGISRDVLTYNILMFANYRLGNGVKYYHLFGEMIRDGFSPDSHTYNIMLHVHGNANEPVKALRVLHEMKEKGFEPNVLHFTSLIDGLSRAGNLAACEEILNLMINQSNCMPDVVCYTVMITGYVAAGELEKAQTMFNKMISVGQLPNVFTYTSMIRGFCRAGKLEELWSVLQEMKERGCNPNSILYTTILSNLKVTERDSRTHGLVCQIKEMFKHVRLARESVRYRRRFYARLQNQ
ncbi:pentatricopeptide repeat-containing protein At3g60050 [Ziziphus jujuba]|uniref:Pentatricopeptide repeat-containing protein At3g60050 n=1 Tax=Ziziphus jujuba TaxID=326968 RepID=A0ABM4AG01_ZIZJJ|nr:pentatricopeptide repeat-containing protein At3g60050-like [Ziziphus jujuba var. spinosa]XP_060675653.1 pentatricopeptide repeat-containing protein At3g60050 [Ziziphus jujuba]XP_060675654.1 pentatricopeptide repeat-containing protein At3g60050 [Ziziphus jujuba]XP_060675655.1 pentatricopeptide repeat-containing protein At3g60050 [Ziziphus jujuba]XP_060675656.1 pentatricopeptide repeat-containing protein At3g60050 [Ziziphus jujuba]XP_060675658.1 pentatricopeptide repeat-containing protein At3